MLRPPGCTFRAACCCPYFSLSSAVRLTQITGNLSPSLYARHHYHSTRQKFYHVSAQASVSGETTEKAAAGALGEAKGQKEEAGQAKGQKEEAGQAKSQEEQAVQTALELSGLNGFHPQCKVLMADGSERLVEEVMAGDEVRLMSRTGEIHAARVVCVLSTVHRRKEPLQNMVTFPTGLKITPWHPVRVPALSQNNNSCNDHALIGPEWETVVGQPYRWQFPGDMVAKTQTEEEKENSTQNTQEEKENSRQNTDAGEDAGVRKEQVRCRVVYSFLLNRGHRMVVNGVECATLAHGLAAADRQIDSSLESARTKRQRVRSGLPSLINEQEEKVLDHPFWGTNEVVHALSSLRGWRTGHIVLSAGGEEPSFVRDPATGLVCALKQHPLLPSPPPSPVPHTPLPLQPHLKLLMGPDGLACQSSLSGQTHIKGSNGLACQSSLSGQTHIKGSNGLACQSSLSGQTHIKQENVIQERQWRQGRVLDVKHLLDDGEGKRNCRKAQELDESESEGVFSKEHRVSGSLEDLTFLHRRWPWIPGPENIRPLPSTLTLKEAFHLMLCDIYETSTDYILHAVFGFIPRMCKETGRLKVLREQVLMHPRLHRFTHNQFPYDLPPGTNHYVSWYTVRPPLLTDEEICHDIKMELRKLLGHDRFDFIWYENPKMSIPDLYHLQVFWRNLDTDAAMPRQRDAFTLPQSTKQTREAMRNRFAFLHACAMLWLQHTRSERRRWRS
eukprot:g5566.t1